MSGTGAGRELLFCTWEGGGHVTPMLWAARRMADRGHRVTVMSDRATAVEADAFDLPFHAWTRAPSRPDKSASADPVRDYEANSPAEVVERLCDRVIVGPAAAYAEDVLEALAGRPDAVVVSQELLAGVMIGAEAAGAPLALLTANIWPFSTLEGVPPFGPGLEPAASEGERFSHAMIARAANAAFAEKLAPLNEVRERFGLPTLTDPLQQFHRADRVLIGASRAFDFAPDELPDGFHYAGPQVRAPHWAACWISPWPADDRRPLVLVAFSTLFQDEEAKFRRTISALGALPVRGLVTLGPAASVDSFRDAAENVVVVESASHDALMPEVSVMITHGGHGAVIRPLLHGVPLLCLPEGRDQADNAARVTARGAGLRLDPDSEPAAIAAAVQRLLAEPGFAENARALGDRIALASAQDGDVVVRELESLAARVG